MRVLELTKTRKGLMTDWEHLMLLVIFGSVVGFLFILAIVIAANLMG